MAGRRRKILTVRPISGIHDPMGLRNFLQSQSVTVEFQSSQVEITCFADLVRPLTKRVQDFGYQVTKVKDA